MSGRSGTEKRRRNVQVGVRLLPEEWDVLRDAATQLGVSPGECLRHAFLATIRGGDSCGPVEIDTHNVNDPEEATCRS